jgi:hypothetical protein
MPDARTLGDTQTGWTYTQDGTPVAYVMPLDDPAGATVIAFPNWWNALRFAVTLVHYNGHEYVGGPSE